MGKYTTLSTGASGDQVKKLQELLQANGYTLSLDGVYGTETENAVKDYQTKNKLTANGIADDALQATLYGDNNVENWTSSKWVTQLEDNKPTYDPSQAAKDAAEQLANQEANKPGAYQSQYGDQIQSMLDQIINRQPFKYDFNADPLYQQYSQQYQNAGKLAMMDTMGQAAGLTGGYGNTYAQGVGQQAYQQNLQQLNGILPELQDAAYGAYQNEGSRMADNLGILQNADQMDYSRYQDNVDRYRQELDYLYNKSGDLTEQEYNRYLNDLSSWEKDRTYWNQKAQDDAAYELALAQANAKGRGGGGGPSKSKAYDTILKNSKLMDEAAAKAYIERMVNGGYITPDEAVYAYQVELGYYPQAGQSVPTTYQDYVKATGNSGVLSQSEYTARKNAGASGLSQYGSYADYLRQQYDKNKKK